MRRSSSAMQVDSRTMRGSGVWPSLCMSKCKEIRSVIVNVGTLIISSQRCTTPASVVLLVAGSGSIFETLRAGKPLVVVVNEALMDNHQRELADVLAAEHYLVCSTPQSLGEVLATSDFSDLKPYPPSEEGRFAQALDSFCGFKN